MILIDRNSKFKSNMSSYDLEEWLDEHATSDTLMIHNIINKGLNIAIPLALLYFFGFNLLILGAGFILTDIFLVSFGYFTLYYLPHKRFAGKSLLQIEKDIEKIKEFQTELKQELDDMNYYTNYKIRNRVKHDYYLLKDYVIAEENYLKVEHKKLEDKKVEDDKRTNKDFDNKIEYFKTYKNRLDYFMQEKEMLFLQPVSESVEKLIDILESRPIGITMIPKTLYIYLTELSNIIEKLNGLGDSYIEKYTDGVKKISEGLKVNIADLIEKIDKTETDDIEVGINVLLQELETENENLEKANQILASRKTKINSDDADVNKKVTNVGKIQIISEEEEDV